MIHHHVPYLNGHKLEYIRDLEGQMGMIVVIDTENPIIINDNASYSAKFLFSVVTHVIFSQQMPHVVGSYIMKYHPIISTVLWLLFHPF